MASIINITSRHFAVVALISGASAGISLFNVAVYMNFTDQKGHSKNIGHRQGLFFTITWLTKVNQRQ